MTSLQYCPVLFRGVTMSLKKEDAIEKAHEMREKYFVPDESPMLAYEKIFRDYNIELRYASSGDLLKKDGDRYIITMPRHTSQARDVFSIACDIGHVVFGLKPQWRVPEKRTIEDVLPSIFAYELLMPEEEFRQACKELNNNCEDVAYRFEVSQSPVIIRMIVLGIDEPDLSSRYSYMN